MKKLNKPSKNEKIIIEVFRIFGKNRLNPIQGIKVLLLMIEIIIYDLKRKVK